MGTLSFTKNELDYLRTIRFLKKDFVDFLSFFKLNPENVTITEKPFSIRISGSWLYTILFETLILSIVNELYFNDLPDTFTIGMTRLQNKIKTLQEYNLNCGVHGVNYLKLADFGTRRRYSADWQEVVVSNLRLNVPNNFIGTSNVMYAMNKCISPVGTMAHEFLQAAQSMVRLVDSQKYALEQWCQEYRGDLGIALTDTIGIDAFLNDFDLYFCKLFDGVRHDSGDPFIWAEKIIKHYEKYNIDPKTKTAVFSDNLTIEKAIEIHRKFSGKIKMLFAIGTNLTNDVGGIPLNIVIKMTKCNGLPVAKISDNETKSICEDPKYVEYLKSVFKR